MIRPQPEPPGAPTAVPFELPFVDRRAAGRLLGRALTRFAGTDAVVFGLARGGVPVADEVARALGLPLDVWVVRKLGVPFQPELGMGALAEGASLVLDPDIVELAGVSPRQLAALVHAKAGEIRARVRRFRGDRPAADVRGKTAILVDDGIATGGTLRAAIRGARRRGAARVVAAAPVGAPSTLASLRREPAEIVCLAEPEHLFAIGAWYLDFAQVADEEVAEILAAARRSA